MRRLLLCGLASLLLAGLPAALPAQGPSSPSFAPSSPEKESERNPPVFQWVVAGACSALVLLIVCMPSRKA
jgi:hypothetical protein